jgi:cell division protein FtsW
MWRTASILIGAVLILLTLGIVMLASTSVELAQARYHNPNYFLIRQGLWLVVALIGAVAAARLDYHGYQWAAPPLLLFSIALLAMTVIPGVGIEVNGSRRWLRAGALTFQPSELAKPAAVLWLAWWLRRSRRHVETAMYGLILPALPLAVMLGLIFIEPDFGTTLLIALVAGLVLFAGGARLGHLLIAAALGFSAFALAIFQDPVRMRRILSFLDVEKYAQKEGFQLMQALLAFVAGGGAGAGLGQGLQKRFYLPEAHTDFIFAIIGEELGIVGTLSVLLLFLTLFVCGMRIAYGAPDFFGRLIAYGLTIMITLQALINIGVVTGCLPTKGLALPFISYGGSNLLVNGIMVGILVNIARHAADGVEDDDLRDIKDRLRSL